MPPVIISNALNRVVEMITCRHVPGPPTFLVNDEASIKTQCIYQATSSTHATQATNATHTTSTYLHSSSVSDLILEMWEPRFLWTPEHSMHSKQPWLREPHSGSARKDTQHYSMIVPLYTLHIILWTLHTHNVARSKNIGSGRKSSNKN